MKFREKYNTKCNTNSNRMFLSVVIVSLLGGFIGGLICSGLFFIRTNGMHDIYTVNLTAIISEYVKTLAKAEIPQRERVERLSEFTQQLDLSIREIGLHRIILVSEAVVSGAKDVTGELRRKLPALPNQTIEANRKEEGI